MVPCVAMLYVNYLRDKVKSSSLIVGERWPRVRRHSCMNNYSLSPNLHKDACHLGLWHKSNNKKVGSAPLVVLKIIWLVHKHCQDIKSQISGHVHHAALRQLPRDDTESKGVVDGMSIPDEHPRRWLMTAWFLILYDCFHEKNSLHVVEFMTGYEM